MSGGSEGRREAIHVLYFQAAVVGLLTTELEFTYSEAMEIVRKHRCADPETLRGPYMVDLKACEARLNIISHVIIQLAKAGLLVG
jgi:hypothetical protein